MKIVFLILSLFVTSNVYAADMYVYIEGANGTLMEPVATEDGVLPVELVALRSRTTTAVFFSGEWCSGRVLSRSSVVVTGNHWDFTSGHCVGPGGLSLSQRIGGTCFNNYRPKYDSCTW